MATYRILKSFRGSQDGTRTESFEAGEDRELSDYLVSCVDPSWISRRGPEIENKAVTSDGTGRRGRRAAGAQE